MNSGQTVKEYDIDFVMMIVPMRLSAEVFPDRIKHPINPTRIMAVPIFMPSSRKASMINIPMTAIAIPFIIIYSFLRNSQISAGALKFSILRTSSGVATSFPNSFTIRTAL